jgi:hypothetical protein
MKKIFATTLVAIAGLVFPALAWEGDLHPDFSGKWELVKEKSDFGKSSPPVAMTLVSESRDGYLHSVQTTQTPQGEKVSENDWYPDGSRHDYIKPVPGYSKTRWEGKSLISESESKDGTFRETVKLTMQPNGKEAIETVTVHNTAGDNHMRLFWRKH